MKETGIIMSGNHPKLILDGIKTMTRRVIKPQPVTSDGMIAKSVPIWLYPSEFVKYCPYGQVGDRLYLKESHKLEMVLDEQGRKWVKCSYRFDVDNAGGVRWFRWADIPLATQSKLVKIRTWNKWRSTRFMYKFLARIWLEITEVRVERLQEITEEDAEAEGVSWSPVGGGENPEIISAVENFANLWDSLNAKRGYLWDLNHWVWVISFKVVK